MNTRDADTDQASSHTPYWPAGPEIPEQSKTCIRIHAVDLSCWLLAKTFIGFGIRAILNLSINVRGNLKNNLTKNIFV